jgi:hypothetical protein
MVTSRPNGSGHSPPCSMFCSGSRRSPARWPLHSRQGRPTDCGRWRSPPAPSASRRAPFSGTDVCSISFAKALSAPSSAWLSSRACSSWRKPSPEKGYAWQRGEALQPSAAGPGNSTAKADRYHRDRHLRHRVAPGGEDVVCYDEVIGCEAVLHQRAQIDTQNRYPDGSSAHGGSPAAPR